MSITLLRPDGVPLTAKQHRQGLAPLNGGGSGRQLGGRSGFRVGTPSNILSATSTTWTLLPCSAMIDPGASTHQGMYGWVTDANVSGPITAADATYARKDLLYIQVNDSSAGDGTAGTPAAGVSYLAGTPSAAPATPALPARSFEIGTITVPQAGGGAPTVKLNPARFVAAGGVQPVSSKDERDALAAYPGLEVARLDVLGLHQRYVANQWLGGEHAEFSGAYGWDPNKTWGPGPLTKTSASFLDELITSPANDTINVPAGSWNLTWRIRTYDANDIAIAKAIPDSSSFMQILDGANVEINSTDFQQNKGSGSCVAGDVYFPNGGQFKLKLFTPSAGLYTRSLVRLGRAK